LRGINQAIACRFYSGTAEIGAAHRIEERATFLLKAIQSSTRTGPGHTDLNRQIKHQGQIRTQWTLDKGL